MRMLRARRTVAAAAGYLQVGMALDGCSSPRGAAPQELQAPPHHQPNTTLNPSSAAIER